MKNENINPDEIKNIAETIINALTSNNPQEKKKGKTIDIAGVQGWVEIIVRDKHGNIKYHIGGRPPTHVSKEKKHNNPIASSFPTKEIDLHYWRKNVITDVGIAEMIRLIFAGLTGTKFGYLAIGSGTVAESTTDTALGGEIARKTASVTQTTTTITNDTALLEATFSSADGLTGTSNVSEAGIFNDPTAGVLLARKVFSAVPINWDAGDSITIRYYVQLTR